MCGWWYPRFKNLKELLNKHVFHIFDVKLPFYPPCEVKCELQNKVSTVTTIKESKDHDSINIQELVRSLQIYELGLPSHKYGKFLALKTINEKVEESSIEDDVEKEVAYLAKNFWKFLKMKSKGKSFDKGRSSSFKKDFNKDYKDKKEPKLIYLVLFCCVLLCFEWRVNLNIRSMLSFAWLPFFCLLFKTVFLGVYTCTCSKHAYAYSWDVHTYHIYVHAYSCLETQI